MSRLSFFKATWAKLKTCSNFIISTENWPEQMKPCRNEVAIITSLTFVSPQDFWLLFLFLLKYSWHTILHLFQVYNIVIWYFYISQNDHHDKSSYYLSPYKFIMILLTISPMLYISSLWLIYFVTGSVYLLISLTCFTPPSLPSPLATTCLFSVSVSLFLFWK